MDPRCWQDFGDLYVATIGGEGQVVVIDDDQQRADELSICLWALNPFGVRTLTAEQALAVQVETVHVILVALQRPNTARLEGALRLASSHHGCVVLGYGADERDTESLEGLRKAGGRDPLPYPFDPPSFIHAVRATRLLATRRHLSPTDAASGDVEPSILKLIAVFSPKGGVGTSTLAVNLAAAVAASGVPTALMDADLEFGSHHVFLDLQPTRSILWCLEDEASLISSAAVEETLLTHPTGLHVLLAPPDPELAEQVRPEHLQRVLRLLRAGHRATIVDAGSGGDHRTWTVLRASDAVLVPIVPELPALRLFMALVRQAAARGLDPTRLVPVLMRANSVPGSHIPDIEAMLGRSLPWRIRSDGLRALASITEGVPFVLGSPEAPLSQEVRALADCLAHDDAWARLRRPPAVPVVANPAPAIGLAG